MIVLSFASAVFIAKSWWTKAKITAYTFKQNRLCKSFFVKYCFPIKMPCSNILNNAVAAAEFIILFI